MSKENVEYVVSRMSELFGGRVLGEWRAYVEYERFMAIYRLVIPLGAFFGLLFFIIMLLYNSKKIVNDRYQENTLNLVIWIASTFMWVSGVVLSTRIGDAVSALLYPEVYAFCRLVVKL